MCLCALHTWVLGRLQHHGWLVGWLYLTLVATSLGAYSGLCLERAYLATYFLLLERRGTASLALYNSSVRSVVY